jgi:hypothetical protein
MAYLVFDTRQLADTRNRSAWVSRLGRDKRAADVTEYLWSNVPAREGKWALDIASDVNRLTALELTKLTDSL